MEKFVTITPLRVRLQGEPGMPLNETVMIIFEKKYPFKILSHNVREGKNITYQLEKINTEGQKGYRVIINNTMKKKGRYTDKITLTTDSKIKPEIVLLVSGYIFEKKKKRKHIIPQPKSSQPMPE